MKSLKEKFGKFEMSKEQVKAVKGGGDWNCNNCPIVCGRANLECIKQCEAPSCVPMD